MSTFIEMPKLSDTMVEGTVVKWRKNLGDPVESGEAVAEIETDKAVMELETFAEGTLSEIYVPEGGKAQVGQKLALLTSPGESKPPSPGESSQTEQIPARSVDSGATAPLSPGNFLAPPALPAALSLAPRIKASPLAKKLAAFKGVNLGSIQGSGPGGRIVARDIEPAPASQTVRLASAAPSVPAAPPVKPTPLGPGGKRIPLSGMRQIIAERLLASKTQIPHFYLQMEVDAGELVRLRAQASVASQKAGFGKLTINDFVLRAAVLAAVQVPTVNAAFFGDAIIQYDDVHLAVAVAVEEGLVTPVIRRAQTKTLREVSQAVRDLAQRARSRRLKPDEYQGGTLTVSNLGSYGIESFSAIINPPQAIILSVGAIVKKPVVDSQGQIVVGERMSIGLSADHRVVDGAIGAQYLSHLRRALEEPLVLLV